MEEAGYFETLATFYITIYHTPEDYTYNLHSHEKLKYNIITQFV
jgi:hypothetical protein